MVCLEARVNTIRHVVTTSRHVVTTNHVDLLLQQVDMVTQTNERCHILQMFIALVLYCTYLCRCNSACH